MFLLLLAASALLLVAGGCGSDDQTPSAEKAPPPTPTPQTGGSTGPTAGQQQKTESRKDSSKKSDGTNSGGSAPVSPSGGASPDMRGSKPVPPAVQREIRTAFARFSQALIDGDAAYLCRKGFASSVVKSFEPAGGCEKVMTARAKGSKQRPEPAEIETMSMNKSGAVEVQARSTQHSAMSSPSYLFFKKEGGSWKVFTPTT